MSTLGRHDEALAEIKEAIRLDPLNLKYNDNLGQELSTAREYDAALEQFKKVIEMDPSFASVHIDLGGVHYDLHKYDLWIQESETAFRLSHQTEYEIEFEQIAKVYASSGIQAAQREWARQEVDIREGRSEPGRCN